MRILDWECTITPDGDVRTAKHPENGTAVSINGRFMGHADVPREVFLWLIRPLLRQAWCDGNGAPEDDGQGSWQRNASENPYNGEPPNKDKDVS
jgi:hypothetical protein